MWVGSKHERCPASPDPDPDPSRRRATASGPAQTSRDPCLSRPRRYRTTLGREGEKRRPGRGWADGRAAAPPARLLGARHRGRGQRGPGAGPAVNGVRRPGWPSGSLRSLRRGPSAPGGCVLRLVTVPADGPRGPHFPAHPGRPVGPGRTGQPAVHRSRRSPRARGRRGTDPGRSRERGADFVPDVAARPRGVHRRRRLPDPGQPAPRRVRCRTSGPGRDAERLVGGVAPRRVGSGVPRAHGHDRLADPGRPPHPRVGSGRPVRHSRRHRLLGVHGLFRTDRGRGSGRPASAAA